MRKFVWAGRCLGGGGVVSVVWMVPVLAEFLSVFVAMSTVLEATLWVFVVAGGVRGAGAKFVCQKCRMRKGCEGTMPVL